MKSPLWLSENYTIWLLQTAPFHGFRLTILGEIMWVRSSCHNSLIKHNWISGVTALRSNLLQPFSGWLWISHPCANPNIMTFDLWQRAVTCPEAREFFFLRPLSTFYFSERWVQSTAMGVAGTCSLPPQGTSVAVMYNVLQAAADSDGMNSMYNYMMRPQTRNLFPG